MALPVDSKLELGRLFEQLACAVAMKMVIAWQTRQLCGIGQRLQAQRAIESFAPERVNQRAAHTLHL